MENAPIKYGLQLESESEEGVEETQFQKDAGYLGNMITWYNNRGAPDIVWKRLYRMVYNSEWYELYGRTTVTHLANAYFSYVVKSIWEENIQGNPLWSLHQKLKKTVSKLSSWSREVYGDTHEEPIRLDREISNLEFVLMNNNNESNRTKLYISKAEYIRYLKIQDSMLRLKSRVKWLSEGDSNTSYFHSVIKDKRRKLGINKIQNEHFQ
uniref:Uncharacterized protein n=1 Tax=Nicotiana tabacum TaxID=4097 RepID=A0A1S3ZGM1_TOBAC|nr:PREDICTED: uncharacterized protein LOC107786519 [Nicotiana tabacum]